MATPSRLDALFHLSRTLSSSLDLDDVLREFALRSTELTGASHVGLFERSGEDWELRPLGDGPAIPTHPDAARRVLEEQRPLVAPVRGGCVILLPLVSRGRSIGLMEVLHGERLDPAAHELEYLRSLADVVASAIANALLYADLRAAEWRHRKLVEDLPLGTYINSLDGHMTYMSPQIEPVLGYAASEWVADGGALFGQLLHPADRERVVDEATRCQREGIVFHDEFRLIGRDGREVWVLDRTVQVADPDGRPLFRQGFLLDITERKQAEERLAHLAYHDPLTGLPNRAMFNEHLELVLARAQRTGAGAAVLFIDLDDFKLVNSGFTLGSRRELAAAHSDLSREAIRAAEDTVDRHRRLRAVGGLLIAIGVMLGAAGNLA